VPYDASQINYVVAGDGPPAIMIHGDPATHSLWRPLAERAAGARTIYAIDLPGFGASPFPTDADDYSLESLAATVVRFADLHGIERFDLVGHSFGGAVSITLAAMAPDRIRTLVAITPMTDRTPPLARILKLPLLESIASLLWNVAPGALRRWFARNWTHVSYGAGYTRERAREVAREVDHRGIVRSICGVMRHADRAAYATAIDGVAATSFPFLLIGAGSDRVIPIEHFEELRARIRRAICHIFPDGSHVPMWQYPDEVAKLVLDFWR
jgi:pimeloyl-ACP methyl ester carboxylesterase